MKTVASALQRNQFSAGRVKFWKTLGFMPASTCFMKETLIRLKKSSRPTQVIPAMKWNQRRMSWVASLPVIVGNTVAAATATISCIRISSDSLFASFEEQVVGSRMPREKEAFDETT